MDKQQLSLDSLTVTSFTTNPTEPTIDDGYDTGFITRMTLCYYCPGEPPFTTIPAK